MTNKRIIDFPPAVAPSGSELAGIWQSGAMVQMTLSAIAGLSKSVLRVNLLASSISTRYGSTSKRAAGGVNFDPTQTEWKLSGTSVATFCALLETTNAANAANVELYQKSGTGSPAIIGAGGNTTSVTSAMVTFDVSASFRPSAVAAIFIPRFWIATPNSADYVTCDSAWIEIQP